MDLGCIDMGCLEKQSKENHTDKDNNLNNDPSMASSKTCKIKKPLHRKNSPLNWFPRKKVDSYLNRKIKLLQEVDGMHSTLDETLGDSNPHYSKVLLEKMAVREAAYKAMETRKAAMVEASWCRILQAARIENKEAEAELLKAEESAVKAFEAATANGVILHDIPDYPQKRYRIETSSPKGGSTTHTIKASFETAFDVDKQVACAVKSAFLKLAKCSSINKEGFKELLHKISEYPELDDEDLNIMNEFSSECESDEPRQVFDKFKMENLVDMMFERLKCLSEDELASLATIVATCGLNAALLEEENYNHAPSTTLDAPFRRRISSFRVPKSNDQVPSLDKVLVKRLTRLEREVLEAKNARNNEVHEHNKKKVDENFQGDLGSFLKKPSCSKFEKEIEEAKKSFSYKSKKLEKENVTEVPSLDKYLVKHMSRLEKEIYEAKNQKENIEKNINESESTTNCEGLDKILVKRVSKLEKEKILASQDMEINQVKHSSARRIAREKEMKEAWGGLSLDIMGMSETKGENKIFTAQNQSFDGNNNEIKHSITRKEAREKELQEAWGGLALGNSVRPHISRLERDKAAWLKAEEEERQKATQV